MDDRRPDLLRKQTVESRDLSHLLREEIGVSELLESLHPVQQKNKRRSTIRLVHRGTMNGCLIRNSQRPREDSLPRWHSYQCFPVVIVLEDEDLVLIRALDSKEKIQEREGRVKEGELNRVFSNQARGGGSEEMFGFS